MKKILIATLALMLGFSTGVSSAESSDDYSGETPITTGAEIANRPWNDANIGALRALDQATIEKFYDTVGQEDEDLLVEQYWGGFTWADLAGDGKYELLVSKYTKGGRYLYIFWQDAPGKLRVQMYQGAGVDPAQIIEDLNGDGKQELLLEAALDSDYRTASLPAPVAAWTQVYRLRNGRYVEASHDFPHYYETEVLPQLENRVSKWRQEVAAQQGKPKPAPGPHADQQMVDDAWFHPGRVLAAAVMERDKILRVLGRDPDAGLAEAREWMKSPDPELVEDAVVVLKDMGGHPQDFAAAKIALIRLEPWQAEMER